MQRRSLRDADDEMTAVELRTELARKIAVHAPVAGEQTTAIPTLLLYRRTSKTACYPGAYEPSLNVFAQGQKRVSLGGSTYVCDGTSFLLASVDLPVMSQILAASEETPLLSMLLKLDMEVVREILSRVEFQVAGTTGEDHGIAVGKTTAELLRPCSRLLDLLDRPEDIPFLSDLIQREIVYRLLRGSQSQRLRRIATTGNQSHRTARAIAWLKANFTKPLRIEDLAAMAGMGVSTLHHHFRALTAMSPLQYQKRLRLQMARQRMLMDGIDAATAAFEVGYESASQFNREYRRLFGQPPIRDIKALRTANTVATGAL